MRVRKIASCLLVIGMSVQILMGIVWILCNFPSGWTYPEAEYYISVADSWVLDEYTGVLYPVLIKGSQIVMGCLGLPFEGLLYLVQIIASFVCYSAFVILCRWNRGRNPQSLLRGAFGGLYLLTVPLCVQWHLSILPLSLLSSLFLLLLGLCIRAAGNDEYCGRNLAVWMGILWALMTLLAPDYWWIALVPVVFAGILLVKKNGLKGLAGFVIVAVMASVLALGTNSAVQTPGSSGKIQRTLGAAMVSRMVWPNFDTTYFFWPDEIKAVMNFEESREISTYADQVQRVFGPLAEKTYGRENANEMYWQMAISCVEIRTKEIVQAIWRDFTAYLFTPWRVKNQLDGSGLSYSGWNYDKMKTDTPRLTRWYVDYGLVSFRVGLIVSVCLAAWKMIGKFGGENKPDRKKSGTQGCLRKGRYAGYVLVVLCALSQAVWYTMAGGGMMDYRNVPVVILLWYYVILYSTDLCLKEQESYEKQGI